MKSTLKIDKLYSVLFAFYLLSGLIKIVLNFYSLEIFDITLLSALSLISLNFLYLKSVQKRSLYAITLLILLTIYIVFSNIYTISGGYSYQKTFLFLTNLIAFISPVLNKRFNFKFFIWAFIFINLIIMIWYAPIILQFQKGGQFYQNHLETVAMYLSLSFTLGICIFLVLSNYINIKNIYRYLLVVIFLILISICGGRGSLIFSLFTLALYISLKLYQSPPEIGIKINNITFTIILIAFISVSVILILDYETAMNVFTRSAKRLSVLIEVLLGNAENETSVNTRLHHFSNAGEFIFQSFPKFIFGHGIGSYGLLDIGQDVRHYPHNILLEIFVELGLIGITIFSTFHLIIFWKNLNLINGLTWLLFVYIFLNHMKSFSLVDMRLYFGFLSLYLISHKDYLRFPSSKIKYN